MGSFDLPEETHDHVFDQLISKDWGELEVLEVAGRLLFPDKIYRRTKDGSFNEVPVLIQVPRLPELRKARVEARQIAKEDGLDLKLDSDLVDDLEVVCTLSHAIRNVKPDHEPWEPYPRALEKHYDKTSLQQIWAKIDALTKVVDPAPDKISPNEMIALMSAIAKERNLGPLFVYGSAAQTTFVVSMVDQLLSLLESKLSSEPSEPSTQASSVSQDL
ncbi:MAG: hypothetical protein GY854_02265 [Deltaproteobacteria bacterium]|nr:hypothetical protein [Deltaproteobacteria bacterium]